MSTSAKGLFISFEGIDGCGKSTQVKLLNDKLVAGGAKVQIVREPGGTIISEEIRSILLNPANFTIIPKTEALLMMASRAQLTKEIINPLLDRGSHVIADRYTDSTLAYQGGGRELSIEDLKMINKFATNELSPDITFFIDIKPEDAFNRSNINYPDRIEGAGMKLQSKVRESYIKLLDEYPKRIFLIDGYDTIDAIHSIIWHRIINFNYEK